MLQYTLTKCKKFQRTKNKHSIVYYTNNSIQYMLNHSTYICIVWKCAVKKLTFKREQLQTKKTYKERTRYKKFKILNSNHKKWKSYILSIFKLWTCSEFESLRIKLTKCEGLTWSVDKKRGWRIYWDLSHSAKNMLRLSHCEIWKCANRRKVQVHEEMRQNVELFYAKSHNVEIEL